ncbi:MAG: phage tail fiber protein [Mucilaginibacter sp.]|nr:phage tail fiber protein [Mucilaginibacter sp.]
MRYNRKYRFNLVFFVVFFCMMLSLNKYANALPIVNLYKSGADNTGKKDISALFQNLIDKLYESGGGSIFIPAGTYRIGYTIFVPSHIKIYGEYKKTIIKANISVSEGRCAFLVGDSHEVNYNVVKRMQKANTKGWPANPDYADIKMLEGLNLLSTDKRIKTRNSSIQNLLIMFDYTPCKSNWGGYGIQFSNAANCYAKNIWTMNACQAIGIGSDTPPSSPACVNVSCYNIHVIIPDMVHTYYAIGFISNSNNCSINNADSYHSCSPDSPDGSLVGMNFSKNCSIKNIKGVVGRSKTSEGILLNNSYGCLVENIEISNAIKGISVSFTDYDQLIKFNSLTNIINNVKIKDSENGICLLSKYTSFNNINLTNCKFALTYNINATNNTFSGFANYLGSLKDSDKKWIIEHNTIKN